MGAQTGTLCGIALAGGYSTRMGRDKAMLRPWGPGEATMLAHTVKVLESLADTAFVACRADHPYAGYNCIFDRETGCGPAAGILAGLEQAASLGCADILVLACDLPLMDAEPLAYLAACHAQRPGGALATLFYHAPTDTVEMLAGIYNVGFLPLLARSLAESQRSLYRILKPEQRNLADLPAIWRRHFINCNSREELQGVFKQQ